MTIKLRILNRAWRIHVLAPSRYRRIPDAKHTLGVTSSNTKEIFLLRTDLHPETIAHELGHAYFSESGGGAVDWRNEELEEFFCELWAKQGYTILKQARWIYCKVLDL